MQNLTKTQQRAWDIDGYFVVKGAFDPDFLVEEGVIDPEDRDLFWFAETAGEIWEDIRRWYDHAGRSLC